MQRSFEDIRLALQNLFEMSNHKVVQLGNNNILGSVTLAFNIQLQMISKNIKNIYSGRLAQKLCLNAQLLLLSYGGVYIYKYYL